MRRGYLWGTSYGALIAMELGEWWLEMGLLGLFLASFLAATILPFSS